MLDISDKDEDLLFWVYWDLELIAANLRVVHDNYFYGSFINFFYTI